MSAISTFAWPQLEIAVTGVSGTRIAQQAGADRVELCSALELGGVTPSQGLVDSVLRATGGLFGINVLVRPRPGNFVYDVDDLATAVAETQALARQGVHGIVLGTLDSKRGIDIAGTRKLIAAAKSINAEIQITFHRAIDHVQNPLEAIELLAALDVDRVLTSGQAPVAGDGVQMLAEMVAVANGRLDIMAGGGVTVAGLNSLITSAGVAAAHLSAKAPALQAGASSIPLGSASSLDPDAYFITDEATVRDAVSQVRELRAQGVGKETGHTPKL